MISVSEVANLLRFRPVALSALIVVYGMSVACNTSPQAKEAKYLQRGKALVAKKDYARAIIEFKNASAVMPKDAEPYYQTGVAYLASGDLAGAIALFRKATGVNPGHEQAQLRLAELLTASSNKEVLQQAAKRLEEILAVSPENSEADDALALAEWKLGKTDDAVARLEDTLKKFPARLQTSVELARLKLIRKDLPGAEQILKQAVASAPQSSPAELSLGQLYMITNQPALAEVELRKATQLDAQNGQAMMGLASILSAGNRMDEAEQIYKRLAALPSPEYKPVYALFLYRIGKRDAALVEFEKLAQQAPNDRAARSRLFAGYLALGKKDQARNLVATALKKNPKDTDALFERAGMFLRDGNAAEAEKDIREVLRAKPDFAEGHVVLAAASETLHFPLIERSELNEAIRINPALLQARLMLARTFTRSNEARAALDVLNKAPASQKSAVGFIIERNWALMSTGETEEVRFVLDQVLRVRRYPEFVIQDAILRMQKGDAKGAKADADEIVTNSPEDIRAVRILLDAYVAQKQPVKAEERLKEIVKAHPQSPQLANLLGQWYLYTQNVAAAKQAFEAAQAADPKFMGAAFSLAEIDYREHRVDAARNRLQAILAADPKNVAALTTLAAWAGESGDQEEAVRLYRSALDIDAANLMALNNLAYTLGHADPDVALKYAQQAAQIAPNNPTVEDTLGWIYYNKAIYSTAVQYLETAVGKEPTPRRQFHLAMSYMKAGKQDLGQKTLQMALKQDPKLPLTEKGW